MTGYCGWCERHVPIAPDWKFLVVSHARADGDPCGLYRQTFYNLGTQMGNFSALLDEIEDWT